MIDNDKIQPNEAPETNDDEAFQSIFDKPTEKVSKKKKGRISREMRNIIVIFLICLGLGFGVFSIFKFIPEEDTIASSETGSSVFSNTTGTENYIFDYSSYLTSFEDTDSLELGGISSVHVKNALSEFTTVPYIEKEMHYNSTTFQEEEVNTVKWDVSEIKDQDFKGVKFSSSYLGFVVGDVLHIAYKSVHAADRNATIPQGNMTYMQECGLDKPTAEITVTFKEGSSYTVVLGDKTPTNNEYYLTINASPSGSGKKGVPTINNAIYRIGSDVMAYFVKEVIYYVDRNLFIPPTDQTTYNDVGDEIPDKYFTEGQLTGFDSIKIDGSNYNVPEMTFSVVDPDYPGYTGMYMMTSPYIKNCTTDSIDEVLAPIATGVAAKETLVMSATDSDKEKFGINTPTCRVTYVVKGVTYMLTLGKRLETPVSDLSANDSSGTPPTYYAVMVNDNPSLFAISSADVPFISKQPENYFKKDIYSCNIKKIKTLAIKPGSDKETNFQVTQAKEDDTESEMSVKANSKVIDVLAFKSFYQKIISLQAIQFVNDGSTNSEPVLTITLTYTTVPKTDVIKFYNYSGSERRYYCTVNGSGTELLDKSSVDELITELSNLLK